MGRTPCCEKVGLKRGRWTAQEDEILMNYIRANGEGSWRSLPKKAGLLRCGKSCRLRWINYLRPDVKRGKFSSDEEAVIIKLHASLGNRWSMIASHLDGRTDNEIKNYWNSHLSRKAQSLPVSDQIKPMQAPVAMARIQKQGGENAKKRRSKGRKTLLPNKKNQLSNSPPRLSEVLEDYNQKVPLQPPTPFMEEESFGDILEWMPDKVSNECTRLPEQQGLLTDIDLGKDLASGTFLDSGFDDNALIYDAFGMDFSHEVLGDVAFNGLKTTLGTTTGDHELAEANQNLEMNASSMTNSTSCITKESDENTGWDYFDGGMQGDVYWDPEQERMVMSWLW